jgi:predicted GTPase
MGGSQSKPKQEESANTAREQAQRKREQAQRDREQAQRDREQAQRDREQAQRNAERAQRDREQAQKDKEQAQRDAQEARDQVQQAGVARLEAAEQREKEAREREREACEREVDARRRAEEAERAKEETERTARRWEEIAANAEGARKAAEGAAQAAEKARQAAEERLMRGIPPDVRPTAEQIQQSREHHGYGKHALNIALVGESGVGKSALLNAVRGLWPDDPGAAEVGVDETTAEVQGYVDQRHPEVKWFDVPGANTPHISGWLYFMDQHLYIFDVLVIVFSDRFTQTIGTLLRNAYQCGIRTFLVRTKADQLIQNLKNERRMRRLNDAQAKKKFVDDTQAMVYKNLRKLELPLQPVFIVSTTGMRDWVTEGDITNVMDEQVIYQTLFPESVIPAVTPGSVNWDLPRVEQN